ncbi:MAG: hypothetical protein ACYS0H_16460, partial [Planctomycetota bacterium]
AKKPEPANPIEEAVLKRHITDLNNRRKAGEDVRDELRTVVEASERAGTAWHEMGMARQHEMHADFTVAGLVRKHRQTVGEQPSDEWMAKYEKLADRIEELEGKLKESAKREAAAAVENAALEAAVKAAKKVSARPARPKAGSKRAMQTNKASAAVAAFQDVWADVMGGPDASYQLKPHDTRYQLKPGKPADPQRPSAEKWAKLVEAAGQAVRAYREMGIDSFLEMTASIGNLTSQQTDAFREAWQEAGRKIKVESPMGANPDKAQIGRRARELTEWAVESGIGTLSKNKDGSMRFEGTEEVADAVHEQLSEEVPGISRETTELAISQYGEFQPLDRSDTKTKIRAVRGQLRQAQKKADLENAIVQANEWLAEGMAPEEVARRLRDDELLPKATGREQATPESIERGLIAEVDRLKKELPVPVESGAGQLKSALSTAKTAAKNRISDLDAENKALQEAIDKKVRLAKPKEKTPLKPDAELAAMREQLAKKQRQRKDLKKKYDEAFPPDPKKRKALTESQRLNILLKSLDRQAADMEADLDALETGKWKPKEKPSPVTSKEAETKRENIAKLREQIVEARKASPEYQANETKRKTARRKKALAKQLEFWEKRLDDAKRGVLPKKRKVTPEAEETLDAKMEVEKVKGEVLIEIEKAKRANWNAGQWIGHGLLEATSYIPKSLMLGMEWSFFKRQGFFYARSHPIRAFAAAVEAIQASFSTRIAMASMEKIQDRPNAKAGEYDKGGVEFTHEAGPANKLEEVYQSSVLRWLENTDGVLFMPLRTWAALYSMFERGNRSFANIMKADMYDIAKRDTMAARNFFEDSTAWTEEDIKETGRRANIFSGRGTGLRGGNAWLDFFFLARRWAWSRIQADFVVPFQLMTPAKIGQWNADRGMRVSMAKLYLQTLLGHATKMAILYWIYMLAAGDDDDKKPTIEWDLRSSDALKMKMGETRVSDEGGIMPAIVLAARVATGETKTGKGEIKSIYGEDVQYGGKTAADFIINYGRYKLGTGPSAILEWASGRDAVGNVVTKKDIAVTRITPLTWREIADAEKELGVKQGTLAALEAFFGASVSTYGPRTKYRKADKEGREKLFEKDLERMQWNSPPPPYSEFLTSGQMKQVDERRQEIRRGVVYTATRAEPDRKDYKNDKTWAAGLEKRAKEQERFQEMAQVVPYDDALEMLKKHYRDLYGTLGNTRTKDTSDTNPEYLKRKKALKALYGR